MIMISGNFINSWSLFFQFCSFTIYVKLLLCRSIISMAFLHAAMRCMNSASKSLSDLCFLPAVCLSPGTKGKFGKLHEKEHPAQNSPKLPVTPKISQNCQNPFKPMASQFQKTTFWKSRVGKCPPPSEYSSPQHTELHRILLSLGFQASSEHHLRCMTVLATILCHVLFKRYHKIWDHLKSFQRSKKLGNL